MKNKISRLERELTEQQRKNAELIERMALLAE
jgi:hypothetical protein